MKFKLLISILLFFSINCFNQVLDSGIVSFSKLEYNFGTLRKNTGEVKYTFDFTNKGTELIYIDRIDADCECTSILWSKEPIAPGKNGSVTVFFNPDKADGLFNKKIQVRSNALNPEVTLEISGKVLDSDDKLGYDYTIGQLGLRSKHINLGIVNKGEIKTRNMCVINNSDKPLSVDFQDVPKYVKLSMNPKSLKPGEVGNIHVEYHSEMIDDWDYIIDRITVILNNKKNTDQKLTITSNIVEDFGKYSAEQLISSPIANYVSPVKQFDTLKSKNPVECKFLIRNEGKSDLVIRDVNPSCGCTAVKPEKNIIRPGDSAYINATFNPKNKIGDFNYSIAIITNDPKNNRQYLWIKGFVKN